MPTASPEFFWFSGLLLGLTGALTPGPLFLLVVSNSLRHGTAAGVQVAFAPLLTDLPIFCASFWLTRHAGLHPGWLALLQAAGGIFLLFLSWKTVRSRMPAPGQGPETPAPWLQGVIANSLNPHPYLFWFTVGSPLAWQGFAHGAASGIGVIAGIYLALVGGKIFLAWLAGRGRQAWLEQPVFLWLLRGLGLVLGAYALLFLYAGFHAWGWI
ncbi:MAG: LysE family transporter [candidate division FCPU426 bacterium]